jgi:hypothetical protein
MIRHSASDDHDRLQRHWNLSLPEQSDMNITTTCTAMLAIVSTLAVSGCTPGPALPVTPNLYLQAEISVLEGVPADRRTVDVDILYATDREPSESEVARQTLLRRAVGRTRSPSAAPSVRLR